MEQQTKFGSPQDWDGLEEVKISGISVSHRLAQIYATEPKPDIASWKGKGGSSHMDSLGALHSLHTGRSLGSAVSKSWSSFKRSSSIFYIPSSTEFRMEDVGLTVRKKHWFKKGDMKMILHHVSCNVRGGEMMAIMGPSGAGKTSLLNCATLNNCKGALMTGQVTINNEQLTSRVFREHCYIVYQKDFLAPKLTCRETLMYAALNCICDSERLATHIDELIENLGLESCQDTPVGDDFTQGLSGGQKRRLSVCLGLVKMPKFLFLDEPTSGLDAVSAYKTCAHLRKITKKYNIAAILTIHQPNAKIYDTFNKLLLLKSGIVTYFGACNVAESWFAGHGHKLPKRTNIADFLLDVVEGEKFTNHFKEEVFDKQSKSMLNTSMNLIVQKLETSPKVSIQVEIKWTLHREAILIFRDPMMYTGRCGAFAFMSVFFSLVYLDSKRRDQENVLTRMWLILWLVGAPTAMASVLIFSHNEDIINMTRNVRNGTMRPVAYVVARFLQLPMMLLFSICSITFGGYLICNWYLPEYIRMVFIHALAMLTAEVQAEFLAIIFSNFSVGMLAYMGIWFAEFLFSGLLVRDEDVIWPLRAICYVLPLRYGVQAMVYSEFIGTTFSGVETCVPSNLTCPLGFTCGEDYYAPCYGESGYQVLENIHYTFPLISGDDSTLNAILYMTAYCVVWKIVYILRILWMVRHN